MGKENWLKPLPMNREKRSGDRVPGLDKGLFSLQALIPGLLALLFSCERPETPADFTSVAGVYTCQETSPHSGVRRYVVEIDRVRDRDDLYIISNFHNAGENEFIYVELSGDSVLINSQAIAGLIINGRGTVGEEFRIIDLYYETDDAVTLLDYYARYSR